MAEQNNSSPVSLLSPRAQRLGGTFFTEEHYLNELSGFSVTLVSTFPSLAYFFMRSISFPNIFPAVHHNQAIQTKLDSVSMLRYAFHAAEDLSGTSEQQLILSVLSSSHEQSFSSPSFG